MKIFGHLFNKLFGIDIGALISLVSMHADGQILGHHSGLHRINHGLLQFLAELPERLVLIQLGAVGQSSSPGKNGGNTVRRGLVPFLMLSVVSGHGPVGRLGLDHIPGRLQHRVHQAQTAVALRQCIALHVTIIVLAGPDKAALALDHIGDHIINEAVLIPEPSLFKFLLIVGLVDRLEEVLEPAVVLLHDGVLGGHVDGVVAGQAVLEALMGELGN